MITVFSDGGADSRGHSAAASIIEYTQAESQQKILDCYAAYLGKATNNEAEIFSAIMGFSISLLSQQASGSTLKKISWVSDSEYSIKSATQYMHGWKRNGWQTSQKKPVKNQGLWKSFDTLMQGIKIEAQHVYGHSGHPENESCDAAVGYLRGSAGVFEEGEVSIETPVCAEWFILDGRPLLDQIRSFEEEGISKDELIEFFLTYFERKNSSPQKSTKKTKSDAVIKNGNNAEIIKKLTRAYIKKMDEIDCSGCLEGVEKPVKKIITDLKKWSES